MIWNVLIISGDPLSVSLSPVPAYEIHWVGLPLSVPPVPNEEGTPSRVPLSLPIYDALCGGPGGHALVISLLHLLYVASEFGGAGVQVSFLATA